MRLAVALLAVVIGCATGRQCLPVGWGYIVPNHAHYDVAPTETSPGGIRFDDSGQSVSGTLLDRLTREVADCLQVSVDSASFVVKVPVDWSVSCDGSQQLLSAEAPQLGCDAKGLPADPNCPCRWRALIQCPNVIVATPSLYLFKDALVRWVTGSNNPWADPALAKCATPSTAPLSLGQP
jgi:hypothetical protein